MTHILARPSINGNTSDEFRDAARELYEAALAMEFALRTIGANVLHGRNYQHMIEGMAARDKDNAKFADVLTAVHLAQELAVAIQEAVGDEK